MAITQSSNINDKIFQAGKAAKSNPYIQRILEDEDLRSNALAALKSARKAYDRASSKNFDRNDLAKDKKLRKELQSAIEGLKDTRAGLADAPRKRHPLRKLLGLALIGGGIAVAVNEDFRKLVLGKLFGGEKEVQYTSSSSTNGSS
ncbi:MAG TPA: hypothetical protein VGO97_00565 [Solirubrobacterales bacterium]|jgi:hypothetical protein|nr:hypothetical protein [Solirubrobacterales bacterium]